MVGIDMHVKQLVCEIGYALEKPKRLRLSNTYEGHMQLLKEIDEVREETGIEEVLVCYEASGLGYLLYDRIRQAGHRCEVLAPTEMLRSASGYKRKSDAKDAHYIYETIRGHVMAGNRLCNIWVADRQLRDDREVVRLRYEIAKQIARTKIQIRTLLRKNGIGSDEQLGRWTKGFREWLMLVAGTQRIGFQFTMESLLEQLQFLESRQTRVDEQIRQMSKQPRYREAYGRLISIYGVGMMSAMCFLTELGDLSRFRNRKAIGAYIGLVPASYESGESSERKGRITRHGPHRIRGILNQALWMHLRYNGELHNVYERIVQRNPRHKKKAVVACMRRLAILMWHTAQGAEEKREQIQVA
jgi:transposase